MPETSTSAAPANPRGRKSKVRQDNPKNAVGLRLKELRREAGLSQEAIGAQGFVSTPGWIKVENGQRSPSEKLIKKTVSFFVDEGHVKGRQAPVLTEELLTLKYLGGSSEFVAGLARKHAKDNNLAVTVS